MVNDEQFRANRVWQIRWLLRIIGATVVLAVVPMLFHRDWIISLYLVTGLDSWPDQPISWYFARSLSLMYFVHGAVVLSLSTDVLRYWPLIKVLGWLNLFIGLALIGIDLSSSMPLWWTAIEGPSVTFGGCLLLWLMYGVGTEERAES